MTTVTMPATTTTFPIFLNEELIFHARKKDVQDECDFYEEIQYVSLDMYTGEILEKIRNKYIIEFNFDLLNVFDNEYDFGVWFTNVCAEIYIEKLKLYISNREV